MVPGKRTIMLMALHMSGILHKVLDGLESKLCRLEASISQAMGRMGQYLQPNQSDSTKIRRQGEGPTSLASLVWMLIFFPLSGSSLKPTSLEVVPSPHGFTEHKGYYHMNLRANKVCSSIENNPRAPPPPKRDRNQKTEQNRALQKSSPPG